MVEALSGLGFSLFKWTLRIGLVISVLFGVFALINFTMQFIIIGMNANVLTDLLAFFQIWMPFNFNTIIVWFVTFVGLYLIYQYAVVANNMIYRVIGRE